MVSDRCIVRQYSKMGPLMSSRSECLGYAVIISSSQLSLSSNTLSLFSISNPSRVPGHVWRHYSFPQLSGYHNNTRDVILTALVSTSGEFYKWRVWRSRAQEWEVTCFSMCKPSDTCCMLCVCTRLRWRNLTAWYGLYWLFFTPLFTVSIILRINLALKH